MQAVVIVRLYEYMDTNTLNKEKREMNYSFFIIENKYVNRKSKRG